MVGRIPEHSQVLYIAIFFFNYLRKGIRNVRRDVSNQMRISINDAVFWRVFPAQLRKQGHEPRIFKLYTRFFFLQDATIASRLVT